MSPAVTTAHVAPGGSLNEGEAPGRRTILLVDDEPDALQSVGDLLEATIPNVRVIRARSGLDAMQALKRQSVDLLLSDFRMPQMDGLELLQWARASKPGVRRALLTAYATNDLVERCREVASPAAFLAKAIGPAQLGQKVKLLLN